MKTLKELFIHEVVGQAVKNSADQKVCRVLDLGCGTAGYVPALLSAFPTIEYVGVEPITASYEAAKKNLAGLDRTTLHFKLGYDSIPDENEASFDLVLSLSVLEHIKQLDRFIALSAKYVKVGGLMVHRYDLGHALHSSSVKEWLHVKVGNTIPQILPETRFVRYVSVDEVTKLYRDNHLTVDRITNHQMPNLKAFEKLVRPDGAESVKELFAWEMKYQPLIQNIPVTDKEKLFPAVAVWGKKVSAT